MEVYSAAQIDAWISPHADIAAALIPCPSHAPVAAARLVAPARCGKRADIRRFHLADLPDRRQEQAATRTLHAGRGALLGRSRGRSGRGSGGVGHPRPPAFFPYGG